MLPIRNGDRQRHGPPSLQYPPEPELQFSFTRGPPGCLTRMTSLPVDQLALATLARVHRWLARDNLTSSAGWLPCITGSIKGGSGDLFDVLNLAYVELTEASVLHRGRVCWRHRFCERRGFLDFFVFDRP